MCGSIFRDPRTFDAPKEYRLFDADLMSHIDWTVWNIEHLKELLQQEAPFQNPEHIALNRKNIPYHCLHGRTGGKDHHLHQNSAFKNNTIIVFFPIGIMTGDQCLTVKHLCLEVLNPAWAFDYFLSKRNKLHRIIHHGFGKPWTSPVSKNLDRVPNGSSLAYIVQPNFRDGYDLVKCGISIRFWWNL